MSKESPNTRTTFFELITHIYSHFITLFGPGPILYSVLQQRKSNISVCSPPQKNLWVLNKCKEAPANLRVPT